MNWFNKIKCFLQKLKPDFRFGIILLLFVIFYGYPDILLKRPQSVHHWRQSDCASLALMYSQNGMHFFEPQTHNLTSGGDSNGYNATSEIPLEYYVVAILYKIFGYHDFIFRLLNTLIFLTGLFYLFKSCQLLFDDFFWSSSIALFFFTSPVLVYYGNNFLTDTSGLAFALIGWYFFLKYYKGKITKNFVFSMVFFLLAGASKISALMSLVAITAIFIIEFVKLFRFSENDKIFTKPGLTIFSFLSIFGIIAGWIFYAKKFNGIHGSAYFSTWLIPLWDMNKTQIDAVLDSVKNLWLYEYFHLYALLFIAFALIFTLMFVRKTKFLLMSISILLGIGTAIYAVLWFATFQSHDYYTINLYIFLIFIILNFFWLLKNRFPKAFRSTLLKFAFLCFLIFNMIHARESMKGRYYGWWSEHSEYKDYHTVTPYLRTIGIAPMDTVISLPDMTHFTLYLMNQRGWTGCLNHNYDSASVANSIEHGAKYLIINGEETLSLEYLKSFMKEPIGEYNSIKIFKLKN